MDFIHSTDEEKVVFMVRKKDGDWLQNYSDLDNKKVAMVNGYTYFPRLNTDTELNKKLVMSATQMPKILLAGRVDTFVSYKGVGKNILSRYPDIIQASYTEGNIKMSFVVVSKKSPLQQRLDQLKVVVQDMVNDGFVDAKVEQHLPGAISPFAKSSNLN